MTHPPPPAQSSGVHLEVEQVVSYLENRLHPPERARVEAHLADCAECTTEIAEVRRLSRPAAQPNRRVWVYTAAAAAAGLLLAVWAQSDWRRPGAPEFREPANPAAQAPTQLAPIGTDTTPLTFRWSTVPGTDRYRISLFDTEGSVLWESEVPGSTSVLPDSIHLTPGVTYLWRVEVRKGVGRWSATPLTEFRIGRLQR
jgi:hypothetical protein